MLKNRPITLLVSLMLLLTLTAGIILPGYSVFALNTTHNEQHLTTTSNVTEPPSLRLETDIPSYADRAGATFNFDVRVNYIGAERKTVNLSVTSLQGWSSTLSFQARDVSAIEIGPSDEFGAISRTVSVRMEYIAGSLPDVGSYPITLRATSGDLSDEITLTAIIRSKHSMSVATEGGLLSMNAVAGKDNILTFHVTNDGPSTIASLTFTSSKPTDWVTTFSPNSIESLGPGQTQSVNVTIIPPANKTVAGDYNVNIRTAGGPESDYVSDSMNIRVTVSTPTIWGILGIILVVLVILGLIVLFMKLGRR